MNREDIIRMAQETGVTAERVRDLVNFAKLVAQHEREACARIADEQRYAMYISLTSHPVQNGTAVGIANAIRARNDTSAERVDTNGENKHDY
jgi:transposase